MNARNNLALIAFAAAAASQAVVIDDFTSGPYSGSIQSDWVQAYQEGTMLGGSRLVDLSVLDNPLSLPTMSATIGDGAAIVSTGVLMTTQTGLNYGYQSGDGYYPGDMSANLSGDTAFRLSFLANDHPLDIGVIATDVNGNSSETNLQIEGNKTQPFSVDIPYASFDGELDWSAINTLDFSFQTSPSGDFALGKLETVPEPASLAALALGGAAFFTRRRRNR